MEIAWKKRNLKAPRVLRAFNVNSKEKFLVVDDDSSIFKLMNKSGQVYVVAGFRCQAVRDETNQLIYSCTEPIHPISCSKNENPREKFVESLISQI